MSSCFACSTVRPEICSSLRRCSSITASNSDSRLSTFFSRSPIARSRFSTSDIRASICCVLRSRFSSFCCRRRSEFFISSRRCCAWRSKSLRICSSFSFASRSASFTFASAALRASSMMRSAFLRASASWASPLLRYTMRQSAARMTAPISAPATTTTMSVIFTTAPPPVGRLAQLEE